MRILWQSNGRFTPSGYGNQTALFVPALKNAGHEMTIFAFYGQQGNPSIDRDGIKTLPPAGDAYGNDVVDSHMRYVDAELLITLIDPFVLDPSVYGGLPWVAWAPLDSWPILPGNVQALRAAKFIWAMSKFGQKCLAELGFNNVHYVPHGVDLDTFKPLDRTAARKRVGDFLKTNLTDRFVVAYNAANTGIPPRKGFFECLAAFKKFSDEHPEALLYLHTDRDGRRGVHIPTIMQMVGLRPDQVVFASQYEYLTGMLPPAYLNDVYNSADVYMSSSWGEGFGIPILEAQAAGCPVIAPDSSAMSELCSDKDFLVSTVPFMNVPGQLWQIPDINELSKALETTWQARNWVGVRANARKFAMEYDYHTVLRDYMLPSIEKIQKEMIARTERQQPITIAARNTL